MEAGRAVMAKDLWAMRDFFRNCAGLSADAAILAVLVDRLGGRERIAIRAEELTAQVGRALGRHNAPRMIEARVIRERLRRLGFRKTRRDGRGMRYEILWEQVWSLDP